MDQSRKKTGEIIILWTIDLPATAIVDTVQMLYAAALLFRCRRANCCEPPLGSRLRETLLLCTFKEMGYQPLDEIV